LRTRCATFLPDTVLEGLLIISFRVTFRCVRCLLLLPRRSFRYHEHALPVFWTHISVNLADSLTSTDSNHFFRVELLTRLRLYTCAAYLRKYCAAEEIRKTTLVCGISPHNQFNVYVRFLYSWKRQSILRAGNVENPSWCLLAHSAPNQ
jgi:hypothetical protein